MIQQIIFIVTKNYRSIGRMYYISPKKMLSIEQGRIKGQFMGEQT